MEQIDQTLIQLGSVTAPQSRFEILQALVEYWHGPISALDGFTNAELKHLSLPDPLRSWYAWAGRRIEIMSGQNWFFSPQASRLHLELSLDGGYLIFQRENQGVYEWATLSEGEDPPVFGRYRDKSWAREEVKLSEHLILNCLFEAIVGHASHSASTAWIQPEQLSTMVAPLWLLPIPAWRWPGSMRFYFGRGAFMSVCSYRPGEESGHSVWVGAKNANALEFLRPHVDSTWDHVQL